MVKGYVNCDPVLVRAFEPVKKSAQRETPPASMDDLIIPPDDNLAELADEFRASAYADDPKDTVTLSPMSDEEITTLSKDTQIDSAIFEDALAELDEEITFEDEIEFKPVPPEKMTDSNPVEIDELPLMVGGASDVSPVDDIAITTTDDAGKGLTRFQPQTITSSLQ